MNIYLVWTGDHEWDLFGVATTKEKARYLEERFRQKEKKQYKEYSQRCSEECETPRAFEPSTVRIEQRKHKNGFFEYQKYIR